MTRSTDTRELVRQAADNLARQGKTPTPSVIREILGKGSPNTIVSELRAWAADRDTSLDAISTKGISDPQSPSVRSRGIDAELMDQLSSLVVRIEAAAKLPASPTEHVQLAISGIEKRFEGVQKYMLLQISEAREEAAKWKGRYEVLRDEFGQWQTVTRQKHSGLVTENAWLRGRLGESSVDHGAFFVDTQEGGKKREGYPGFPRARSTDDESA